MPIPSLVRSVHRPSISRSATESAPPAIHRMHRTISFCKTKKRLLIPAASATIGRPIRPIHRGGCCRPAQPEPVGGLFQLPSHPWHGIQAFPVLPGHPVTLRAVPHQVSEIISHVPNIEISLNIHTYVLGLMLASPVMAAKIKHRGTVYADSADLALKHPEGVACGDDSFVVADTGNSRISVQYAITVQGFKRRKRFSLCRRLRRSFRSWPPMEPFTF